MTDLKPGQRVVLREGSRYAANGPDDTRYFAPRGGLSVTVVKLHETEFPHAAYEWEGITANGRGILFMGFEAEPVGNLP